MKRFTILYPDGSKKKVGSHEREQLLLAGNIKKLEEGKYRFVGQRITLHDFADLRVLVPSVVKKQLLKRFYPGKFTIEAPDGSRKSERLESAEAMAVRLDLGPA